MGFGAFGNAHHILHEGKVKALLKMQVPQVGGSVVPKAPGPLFSHLPLGSTDPKENLTIIHGFLQRHHRCIFSFLLLLIGVSSFFSRFHTGLGGEFFFLGAFDSKALAIRMLSSVRTLQQDLWEVDFQLIDGHWQMLPGVISDCEVKGGKKKGPYW